MQTIATTMTSSAFNIPHVEVDVSKLQMKKNLTINEGVSSLIIKFVVISSKDKVKGLEPTDEEKKKMKVLEIEKLRQINNFLRQ